MLFLFFKQYKKQASQVFFVLLKEAFWEHREHEKQKLFPLPNEFSVFFVFKKRK